VTLPDTMRAARLHRVATPDVPWQVQVDEMPVPHPGPGELLVEVRACGVCASDLHVAQGVTPHGQELPLTLGHEPAGVVAAVGDGIVDWQPGDRVAVMSGRPCGRCSYCSVGRDNLCIRMSVLGVDADGALATYVLADPSLVVPIPIEVSYEHAAITTDAVATPYHALKRAGVADGAVIAVVGLGGLGLHAVLLAKLVGMQVIGIDRDPVQLERALDWGADHVVDANEGSPSRKVRELTAGGADRALEFVGTAETVDQAVKCVAPGGRAVVVGLGPEPLRTVPIARFVSQETELVGSFGATAQDLGELFDLLEEGRLDLSLSITHTTDLDGVPEALERLASREGSPIRTVVTGLA
jgi:D-arabinose 1-dehydrogenase-like Zn-dependent alcohol dehydrogenase